jgi:dihydroxy-acid dehydratase
MPLNPAKKTPSRHRRPDRAAARSHLRSVGISKEGLRKPIIGIANT